MSARTGRALRGAPRTSRRPPARRRLPFGRRRSQEPRYSPPPRADRPTTKPVALGVLFGDTFAGIDDLLWILRDQRRTVLARAAAREHYRRWWFGGSRRDPTSAQTLSASGRSGLARCGGALRSAVFRVVLLAAVLIGLAAFADAQLRGRPLPLAGLDAVARFVAAGVRDLPGVDLAVLLSTAGRDHVLAAQCLLACALALALVRALMRALDLCVVLLGAGALVVLYLALFAIAVVLATPVVLAIAAVRVVAYRRWIFAVERLGAALEQLPGRLVAIAAALLPHPHRARYAEEFDGELRDLAHSGARRWHLLAYSLRVLIRTGHLRAELRSPSREKADP